MHDAAKHPDYDGASTRQYAAVQRGRARRWLARVEATQGRRCAASGNANSDPKPRIATIDRLIDSRRGVTGSPSARSSSGKDRPPRGSLPRRPRVFRPRAARGSASWRGRALALCQAPCGGCQRLVWGGISGHACMKAQDRRLRGDACGGTRKSVESRSRACTAWTLRLVAVMLHSR
jgi:hypothetical protein